MTRLSPVLLYVIVVGAASRASPLFHSKFSVLLPVSMMMESRLGTSEAFDDADSDALANGIAALDDGTLS